MLTPLEYQYYSFCFSKQDSIQLLNRLDQLMEKKKEAFYPYDSSENTKIIIDRILTSPKCDRFAAFVIIQDTVSNLSDSTGFIDYSYESCCFIGLKEDNSIKELKWFQIFNGGYTTTYENSARLIEKLYYRELSTVMDSNGKYTYKYNINDLRFWSGPVWDIYFDE